MRMASMTSAVNLSRIALVRAHTLGVAALPQHVSPPTPCSMRSLRFCFASSWRRRGL